MKNKYTSPEKLRKDIVKLLSKEEYKPLRRSDISKRLNIHPPNRIAFRHLLADMVSDGSIVCVKGGRYLLPRKEELITGVLKGNRRGFGFVIPLDKATPDLYIHRENMSTALDGDTVLVSVIQPRKKYGAREPIGPEGRIVEVVKRTNTNITGTLLKTGNLNYVVPDNLAIFNDIYIDSSTLKSAEVGDKVICRITEWRSKHLNPEGIIVRVIGSSREYSSEVKAVIERFELPKGFPSAVRTQASKIPSEIPMSEIRRRTDYRAHEVFTIDPDKAKDFDDAVSLTHNTKQGTYTLGVHIADVAYYVPQKTALDAEAARRGNSYYLTDTVVSMLPKRLSNDLCSLRPGVPRLTKSVIMNFTSDGELIDYEIKDSIIKSKKRFTYGEVLAIIEGRNSSPYTATIKMMAEFSQVLRERRRERGSVTFDMPEMRIIISQDGKIQDLEKEFGDISHKLIEEFMLAANETVALHLSKKKVPAIYRIHADPEEEKINNLVETARFFGFRLPKHPNHFDIQRLLDRVEGKPISYIINLAYLKTMKLAEYSTKNIGHFGLASDCYLHFTSPIRRYPDLTVHRALDSLYGKSAGKEENAQLTQELQQTAENCSESERKAAKAEEALREIAILRYINQTTKEDRRRKFAGVISDVNSMGLVVYLDEFQIQGIIKMSSLVSDYFRVNRKAKELQGVRTRKTYSVGQEIRVRIKKVDLVAKELELTFLGK